MSTEIEKDVGEAPARTAAEKIGQTLRELSKPGPDAEAMELTLASLAMGFESGFAKNVAEQQESGELDEFMLALTRFIASHRSDSVRELVVVELPRRDSETIAGVPAGTRLHLLDEAIAASRNAGVPW